MQAQLKNKNVHWSRKYRAFAVNGVPLRGAHPTLKALFYPHYSYERAKLGPTTMQAAGKVKVTKHRPGLRAGILVDSELKRTIQLLAKYALPPSIFQSFASQQAAASKYSERLSERDLSLLKKRLAPATTKLWQAFQHMSLVPEATQVAVGCVELKTATAVDVVCRDSSGARVIIEVKTGFEHYYHRHTGNSLVGIRPATADSAANQHQLQLLLTYELYRHTFPGVRMGGGFIFRVDSFGVDVVPLQSWARRNAPSVFKMLKGTPKARAATAPTTAKRQRAKPT